MNGPQGCRGCGTGPGLCLDCLVKKVQGPRCVRFDVGGVEHVLNFDEAETLIRRIRHAIDRARAPKGQ